MWETWVRSLGWEDPLEKVIGTHSSILAWKVLYSPRGHKESDTTEQLSPSEPRIYHSKQASPHPHPMWFQGPGFEEQSQGSSPCFTWYIYNRREEATKAFGGRCFPGIPGIWASSVAASENPEKLGSLLRGRTVCPCRGGQMWLLLGTLSTFPLKLFSSFRRWFFFLTWTFLLWDESHLTNSENKRKF